MILTNEDKQYLIDCGYEKEDFNQIARAISKTTYKYKGEKITAEKAVVIVGREAFLSGLARSAFHFTASREGKDGNHVYFNSHNLFKGQLGEPLETIQNFKDLAKRYEFKILQDGDTYKLCAKDTDNHWTRWIGFSPKEDKVSFYGNTDHLNIWLCDTRKDLTPEKCIKFVEELNEVFKLSGKDKILIKELIDPEDWQEIADVRDAYQDKRYTSSTLKNIDKDVNKTNEAKDSLESLISQVDDIKNLKEKILSVLDSQTDGFVIPNQSEFYGDTNNFFKAVDELIKDGVLRKRNCEGLAYEYEPSYLRNKATNKEYSNDKEK